MIRSLMRGMMHAGWLLPTIAITAVARAQPAPRGSPEYLCAQNAAQFPRLIGGDARSVEAALRVMPGIVFVRVVGPDSRVTMDHRPDRATVLVVDGTVRRITCG